MQASLLRFDDSLSIATVETIHQTLLTALAAGADVVVDCTAATDIDLSFIQLVLAARRSAIAKGTHVKVIADSQGHLASVLLQGGLVVDTDGASPDVAAWLNGGA